MSSKSRSPSPRQRSPRERSPPSRSHSQHQPQRVQRREQKSRGAVSQLDSHKVFLTNINGDISQVELQKQIKQLFQKYGQVAKLSLKKHKKGYYYFGFLQYPKGFNAQQACKQLDQHSLFGKNMKVRQDRQSQGCFNCGGTGHFARQCPRNRNAQRRSYSNQRRDNYNRNDRRDSRRDPYERNYRDRDYQDRDRERSRHDRYERDGDRDRHRHQKRRRRTPSYSSKSSSESSGRRRHDRKEKKERRRRSRS